MLDRLKIKWKRQWGGNDRIIWVSVNKLDKFWRDDEGYYLDVGQGRPAVYERIYESAKQGITLPMPHASFDRNDCAGRFAFTDGRHRFAWVRDHGGSAIPVTFARPQVDLARKRFGTRQRVCIVRLQRD